MVPINASASGGASGAQDFNNAGATIVVGNTMTGGSQPWWATANQNQVAGVSLPYLLMGGAAFLALILILRR